MSEEKMREIEFALKAKQLGLPLCKVTREEKRDEVYAFFHGWEKFGSIVPPSMMVGGHEGGQFSRMYGICEDENGMIKRIEPENIRFIRFYDEPLKGKEDAGK